ncbi:hypothetical protein ACHAPE_010504 [Trichoderma viride]
MQASLFIGFVLLATKVLAGGFAGALERVWLFYAYQIDELNEPAQRTIGLNKKTGNEWWIECPGSMPNRRCNFSELLNFLGGCDKKDLFVSDEHGNPEDIKSKYPDPEQTAKKVYAHFLAQAKPKVPDWQGYRMIYQGTENYNDNIEKIGGAVEKAAKAGGNTEDNIKLFQRFAQTTAQIKTARVGDHGPYLIDAAETRLKPLGIDVVKESVGSLGHNPADPSKVWKTVDWEQTMARAVAGGEYSELEISVVTDHMREDFYLEEQQAREHRAVIQSFEIVENKANGCL